MSDPNQPLKVHTESPFVMLTSNVRDSDQAALEWSNEGLTVRLIRGSKMRTVRALFDEVSAALQFPYYFGENWDAFRECIADMDWLSTVVGIVIVIRHADEVLADDDPAELEKLIKALNDANAEYSKPIAQGEWWDRPAVSFHTILHSLPEDAAATRARWSKSGAVLSEHHVI